MDLKIEYDESNISLAQLHRIGIRSTIELKEVVEWEHSFLEEDTVTLPFATYIFTGLTNDSRAISVVLTTDDRGKFILLDAEIPKRNELLKKLT